MRLLILIVSLTLCSCANVSSTDSERSTGGTVQRILITTRQETGLAVPQLGDPGVFYTRRRGYGPLPEVNRRLDGIAADYGIRRVEGWYISAIGQYCEVYELKPGASSSEVIEAIGRDDRVALVQPMNTFETWAVIYDDPYASLQPALSTLSIDAAHEFATGRGVTVAVIDSTVDRRHPELRGRVSPQINLVNRGRRNRAEVHGTAVAGVIGSAANNGAGIVGVAPDARIAGLRACWTIEPTSGRAACSSFSLAQALESAIRLEADIINMSLAGPDDPLLTELIDAAIERGVIVVSAAPQATEVEDVFPASHPGVIAVASSESIDPDSTGGVRAPGAEIMSTIPKDQYAVFSGNSMSSAYVAGVSALIRERSPEITAAQVRDVLEKTMSAQSVNACQALAAAAEEPGLC